MAFKGIEILSFLLRSFSKKKQMCFIVEIKEIPFIFGDVNR